MRISGTKDRIVLQPYPMFSDGSSNSDAAYIWDDAKFKPSASSHWKTTGDGIKRLDKADRLLAQGKTLRFVNYLTDYPVTPIINSWNDTQISGYNEKRVYVVQTLPLVVARCMLMSSDPGDLVLDPTCGSGTTAFVAEQRGRRWIKIDTSRVALKLARARIMGARYPFYLLTDSREGQLKEGEITRTAASSQPVSGNIRHGFVYERVPDVMSRSGVLPTMWRSMSSGISGGPRWNRVLSRSVLEFDGAVSGRIRIRGQAARSNSL